ncbi:MAG: pyrimidine 5'-nucleotidase, partial [Boseongicola sp.]
MIAKAFNGVSAWVFDLDNTLYPPEARLFDQIEIRMTSWVARELGVSNNEADRLRRHYWRSYGTTLAGLMAEHDVDPAPYLTDVHEISMDHLVTDPALTYAINALSGRRIVYTNGSEPYARRVLAARGLENAFDAVYGVEHADFRPKPDREAFEAVFALDGIDANCAAMFEDDARNLAAPFEMGLRTVHVTSEP